jgi:hypothetical protein
MFMYGVEDESQFWTDRLGLPENVNNWNYFGYEYLDDLRFIPDAREMLAKWAHSEAVISAVEDNLKNLGWEGDGEMGVLWLPPFAGAGPDDNFGCYLLHVKQLNDGISWLASPYTLPYHRLFQPDRVFYSGPGVSPWGADTKKVERKGAVRWLSDYFKSDT